jgi:hypothetical protein
MTTKNKAFMIEVIEESYDYRTIIRNWVEIEGYTEIVYQEWCMSIGQWVDKTTLPAFSKEQLQCFQDSVNVVLENFV